MDAQLPPALARRIEALLRRVEADFAAIVRALEQGETLIEIA